MRSNIYVWNWLTSECRNCSRDMIIFLKLFCFWHRWCHRIWWWRQPQIWLEISPSNWRSLQWSFWVVPAGIAVGGVPHLGENLINCCNFLTKIVIFILHIARQMSPVSLQSSPSSIRLLQKVTFEKSLMIGGLCKFPAWISWSFRHISQLHVSLHCTYNIVSIVHIYSTHYHHSYLHQKGWTHLIKPFPLQVLQIFFWVGVKIEQILKKKRTFLEKLSKELKKKKTQ